MLVDELTNLVHVALREDAALVDQQDVRGHRFDFVQDVARHDDALALAAPLLDHPDRLAAHDRIHPRERLVEHNQLRVVHERLRHLHALTHALAVGADLLVPDGIGQLDELQRARERADPPRPRPPR